MTDSGGTLAGGRHGRFGNDAGRDTEHRRRPGVCLRHRRPDPQRGDQPGERLGKRLRRPVLRERPPDARRHRHGDVRHIDRNYLDAFGPNTAATLTIGSGITVQGGSGTVGGYYSADSLVNDGTITSASGQTLTIQGSNWVNNGTITANGATVNLGGSFTTAALGSFSASGSTVNLTGTLNNANTTFTLSPAIGAWDLHGGTINGGTITSTGGSKLALTDSGGTLAGGVTVASGTTLDGTQNIGGGQEYAYVTGGLTLNGAINLGNASGSVYGDLYFENGPQTLSGTGTVTLGTSTTNYLDAFGPNTAATLTIGSGITVQGGSGTVGGYYSADSLVNDGTITSASGQTLTIQGSNWVNAGTITANGAIVDLEGSFTTAALGNFTAVGGAVNLMGTLNNAGATLALSPVIGAWRLLGATIAGGTITSSGGSVLALTDSGGNLTGGVTIAAGATLDGTQDFNGAQDYVDTTAGLVLDGAADLGSVSGSIYGYLYLEGSQPVLSGTGTVVFGGNGAYNAVGLVSGTLTIGSGITVRGQNGNVGYSPAIGGSPSNIAVVNQGTIQADVRGGTITVEGSAAAFLNSGTVNAGLGAINISTGNVGTVNSGTLSAGPTGTLAITGPYTQSAAGSLNEVLGGSTTGLYGKTSISGTASLNGSLDVNLVNGYTPPQGIQLSHSHIRLGDRKLLR